MVGADGRPGHDDLHLAGHRGHLDEVGEVRRRAPALFPNLDPTLAGEIMQLFASLQAQGTAVLIASHDLGLVRRMRKRVLVLDHGRLMDDIDPEDLAA